MTTRLSLALLALLLPVSASAQVTITPAPYVDGSGTPRGPILAAVGNCTTAPPYSFTGDTNTGMGSSAADTLCWVTGGTARASLSTTAFTLTVPIDLVSGSNTWREVISGTSKLIQYSNGGAFSTVGTLTSGGAFTASGLITGDSFETSSGGIRFVSSGRIRSDAANAFAFEDINQTNIFILRSADWGTTLSAQDKSRTDTSIVFVGAAKSGMCVASYPADAAVFLLRGTANATTLVSGSANFSTTKGSAGDFNVFYDAAGASGAGYYTENLLGSTLNVKFLCQGS